MTHGLTLCVLLKLSLGTWFIPGLQSLRYLLTSLDLLPGFYLVRFLVSQ